MKTENKVMGYEQPVSEIIILRTEAIICQSVGDGENEGTEDEELEP